MSWSFIGMGKPDALAVKAAADMSRIKCVEPEETIKAKAIEIIEVALAAYPKTIAVDISAGGSQWTNGIDSSIATNTFTLMIKPVHGFVE